MPDEKFMFRDNEKTYLIKYYGCDEEVVIPDGVSVIGEAAFASCFNLQKVEFPSSLKEIKKLAFFNCVNLTCTPALNWIIAEDAFSGCIKMKKRNFILKAMTIKQIENEPNSTFYVRDYQRGYRWTNNEIEELLNDIKETTSRYCVQPLIVKLCEPQSCKRVIDKFGMRDMEGVCPTVSYELVDGQQRLTTILLILNECYKMDNSIEPVNYQIYYELLRKIDNHYIDKAKETIINWLSKQSEDFKINEFVFTIREKLFFIWYEMKIDEKVAVEDEFRNINDGQTPLTNAELFKALLLNPENASIYPDGHKEDIQAKLFEMAFQWDDMEQKLRDDDFWFFISNDECSERTHLDYLFELFAVGLEDKKIKVRKVQKTEYEKYKKNLIKLDKTRDRYSFLAVKAYVEYLDLWDNKRFENVKQVWKEIVEQYNHLYSWYSDIELYHTIGYLISTEKSKRGNSIVPEIILDIFKNCKDSDMSKIKTYVRDKITDYLKRQIIEDKNNITIFSPNYYERNKKDIRDFLLYVNVWSTYKAKERFPFARFKNTKSLTDEKTTIKWDIEHISARNLKESISEEELEKIKPWWQMEETKFVTKEDKIERKWNQDEWKAFAQHVNESAQDNEISNLVLLDSNTNRSYGNALFFGKRREIIERDKKSAYIPICTKNVFLKYYTESPDFSVAWSEIDKAGYFFNILECVKDGVFGEHNIPIELKKKIAEIEEVHFAKEEK